MLSIEPSGDVMGATIRGVNLSEPLSDGDFGRVLEALGQYSVICFQDQSLTPEQHIAFTARFGEVHALADFTEPGYPDLNVLSNIVENGRPLGHNDAGMIWHKDMTYAPDAGFATILFAIKVPRRDGRALGATQFINARAAADDLPAEVIEKLMGRNGLYSVEMFNALVRDAGSKRPLYNNIPEHQKRPIRPHPIIITHPLTGKTVLYCDPNHVGVIESLEPAESDELLKFLAEHQLQEKYRYTFEWTEGDVLMWDNLSVLHCATLDYGPDEPRLIRRSQAFSDKVRNPAFVKAALDAALDAALASATV